jgi:Family of unknown function (DUF6476)
VDDRLIRYLKAAVVAGGVALVLGTALLAFLLVQRARERTATAPEAAPEAAPATLPLPAGARIGQAVTAGNQLVLLGEAADQRRFLAVVDLATGRRRYLLWIVPETP